MATHTHTHTFASRTPKTHENTRKKAVGPERFNRTCNCHMRHPKSNAARHTRSGGPATGDTPPESHCGRPEAGQGAARQVRRTNPKREATRTSARRRNCPRQENLPKRGARRKRGRIAETTLEAESRTVLGYTRATRGKSEPKRQLKKQKQRTTKKPQRGGGKSREPRPDRRKRSRPREAKHSSEAAAQTRPLTARRLRNGPYGRLAPASRCCAEQLLSEARLDKHRTHTHERC